MTPGCVHVRAGDAGVIAFQRSRCARLRETRVRRGSRHSRRSSVGAAGPAMKVSLGRSDDCPLSREASRRSAMLVVGTRGESSWAIALLLCPSCTSPNSPSCIDSVTARTGSPYATNWLGQTPTGLGWATTLVTFRLVLKREDPHARRGVRIFAVDDARAPAGEFVTDGRAYRARPHSLRAACTLNPGYEPAGRSA